MKRIILNRTYDTDFDYEIASWSNGERPAAEFYFRDFYYQEEHLYRNRSGLYYLYIEGGKDGDAELSFGGGSEGGYGRWIDTKTPEEAKAWAVKRLGEAKAAELFN